MIVLHIPQIKIQVIIDRNYKDKPGVDVSVHIKLPDHFKYMYFEFRQHADEYACRELTCR